jgi:hypothetical protein
VRALGNKVPRCLHNMQAAICFKPVVKATLGLVPPRDRLTSCFARLFASVPPVADL